MIGAWRRHRPLTPAGRRTILPPPRRGKRRRESGPEALLLDQIRRAASSLTEWMLSFASPEVSVWYSGGALWAFAFAESSFFPIPPDALLIALCLTEKALDLWPLSLYYALMCSIGSVLGGLFGYGIGLKGGRPVLQRLFSQEKIAAVDRAFERHGVWAVAVAGFTPIPYKVFTIASGAFRLSVTRFTIASAASRSLRFFLVALACIVVGRPVKDLLERHFALFTVAFIVALIGGFVLVRFAAKRASAQAPAAPGRPEETNGD